MLMIGIENCSESGGCESIDFFWFFRRWFVFMMFVSMLYKIDGRYLTSQHAASRL